MNDSKTVFQSASANLEQYLNSYKYQYPRNLGALLRNFFPIFLIIAAVIILPLVTFFYSATSLDLGFFIAMIFVIPVFLVFAIIMLIKNKREKQYNPQLRQQIAALRQELDPYKKYPDVQQYFDGFDKEIAAVEAEKKHHRSQFWTIVIVLFAVIALYCTYSFIWMKNFSITTNHSAFGETEILGLSKSEPFLTLAPLKTDIPGGGKVESAKVDFYYQENWLVLKEINISTPDTSSIMRLVITDRNGTPAPGCPKFVFKASKNNKIQSEQFHPTDIPDYDYSTNYFEAFRATRYLHANKDNLCFLVEKVK